MAKHKKNSDKPVQPSGPTTSTTGYNPDTGQMQQPSQTPQQRADEFDAKQGGIDKSASKNDTSALGQFRKRFGK